MGESSVGCLFLSEEDLVKAGGLDMSACVRVMEDAFRLVGMGDYIMGGPSKNEHGHKLYFPTESIFPQMPIAGPDRRFMSLIGYLGGDFHVTGMKWYGSNIENANCGLPRSILMTVLNDPETARPLAIMSANTISAMRTGAMPGLAANHLAKQNTKIIGLVGAGVISKACLMGLCATLPDIVEVKIYDLYKEKSKTFAVEMGKKLGVNIRVVDSLAEAIIDSDVVNVAAAGAKKPIINKEWLKQGVLLSIPARVDLDEGILMNSKLVVDEWKMHLAYYEQSKLSTEAKDFQTAYLFKLIEEGKLHKDSFISLGSILSGESKGREHEQENIIFISGGMAIQDIAWSYYLYKQALNQGIGQVLKFWEELPAI